MRSRYLAPASKCVSVGKIGTDQAFDNFASRVEGSAKLAKHKNLGFPTFEKKSEGIGSCRLNMPISIFEDRIQLPKLGTIRLKECSYIPTSGVEALSATTSEQAGKWYVAVLVGEMCPTV